MGTGHEHGAELADGLAAADEVDGEALMGIGPDAIRVDVHHHGADLAAGAVLIAIQAGAKDTDPAPGATAVARTASHRKVRRRATRLGLILAAVVVRGTVGGRSSARGRAGWAQNVGIDL